MKHKILLFISVILILKSSVSLAQNYYWIAFTDKNNSNYSLSDPQEYLSQRAIERREKQGISIDSLDLPVNVHYIDSVIKLEAEFLHASKWLNGITVKAGVDSFKHKVLQLPFVKEIQLTKPGITNKSTRDKFHQPAIIENDAIDTSAYGASVYQTGLMNGQFLHNQGFNGDGIHIAVLDGGFSDVNVFTAFDSLWANNQILGTKDFVEPGSNIFDTDSHGMSVLSCMGGNVPGELVGTARKAFYWLLRSEENGPEFIIEEDKWVSAAEFADSVGVDIINSSLGYSLFDDTTTNHSYAEMDGNTTRVTQGANIAASRGILVFSSAGNEGDDPWKYIIAPSDGDNVIGVGASNKFGFAAPFTSFGPAYDGDIKPNVTGVGWNTYLQHKSGVLAHSSGTSFSSPVVAGMAACLWQAVSYATAKEVKRAIEMSASLYENPDSLLGYGIPDFKKAWIYLTNNSAQSFGLNRHWKAYPNPFTDRLILEYDGNKSEHKIEIEIYSIEGRLLKKWQETGSPKIILNGLQGLPTGILMLRIKSDLSSETIKILKH